MPVSDPYGYIEGATRPSGNYAVKADSSTTRQGTQAEYDKYLADNARTLELAEGGQDDLWEYVTDPVAFEDFKVTGIKPYEEFNLVAEIAPLLSVVAAFVPPLAPIAQTALTAINAADGDLSVSDALGALGLVGLNPVASVTENLNNVLGVTDTAFALTDDVLVNLAEGDLQGAALDYANADMVDVDLDSSIGDALASFDDNVIQPIASLGNELLDPLQGFIDPVVETVSNIGSGINDAAQPLIEAASSVEDAVVATGDAIQTVADPIIDPIVAAGDVAQENIIDPIVDVAAQVEDVVSEAIPSLPDTPDLSDIEYADLTIDTPDINIPTPDLSFIPALFSDLLASTGTTATNTTDMKSLFSDDLFKFQNEIIMV